MEDNNYEEAEDEVDAKGNKESVITNEDEKVEEEKRTNDDSPSSIQMDDNQNAVLEKENCEDEDKGDTLRDKTKEKP